jgi:hypothetical protein
VTGSADTRGLPCRITRLEASEAPMDAQGRAVALA